MQICYAVAIAALLLVSPAYAQEESGFTPTDFALDAIENAAKGAVIGDVPSDDLNILTKDIYTKFLAGGYATKKEYTTCQRVANAQAETGLDNLNQKWWQGGWFNLGYKAIKYSVVIASGAAGAGLNDVVAEEGRGIAAGAVEAHIRAEDDEVVEISPSNRCNAKVRAIWDKKNMKLRISVVGNCNCRDIKPRWSDLSHDTLKEFKVDITADVVVKSFEVEEKNPLIFWREKRVKVFLGTKNMEVDTKANCQCGIGDPPLKEPEDGSISEEDSSQEEPEDSTQEQDDSGVEENEHTTGGLFGWLLGGKKDGTEKEPEDKTPQEKWQCGAPLDIDGQAGAATYPYTDENRLDASTQCNGMCSPHQECRIIPESVGAYSNSCTYCKDICNKGEFTTEDACVRAKGADEECVAAGKASCYAIKKKEETKKGATNCEGALRAMLNTYGGWFDPPLTVAGNGAEMYHEHRCMSDAEFDQFTRQPFIAGIATAEIRAMCPTLSLDSSTQLHISGGAKGLCATKSVFSF